VLHRNVKDEKLFVGLGNVNVICVGEHHEYSLPAWGIVPPAY
jgi:hypothetical protein